MSRGSYDGGIDVLPTNFQTLWQELFFVSLQPKSRWKYIVNFHAVKREKTIPGRLLYRIKSLTEKAQQKNWHSHIYFVTLEIANKNKRQNLSLLIR